VLGIGECPVRKIAAAVILAAFALVAGVSPGLAEESIQLFCGAGFKKPVEEIVESFQKKTGMTVNAIYGGAPALFSQILLAKKGDLFLAPSPDIMEKAVQKKMVVPDSVRGMAYVVPCIDVQKGNPKQITGLKDLLKPGVKIAIGNPEMVYVGTLAVEIAQKSLTESERKIFRSNIVTYAEDFNKLATYVALKQVDAVIGFHYLQSWHPDKIETVKLRADEIPRIGASRVGITTFASNRDGAQRFIEFLLSADSEKTFRKYQYFGSADEAFEWIGAKKPVGGAYVLPPEWVVR
jgi:molybdate transport system substrate-binding protein